MTAEGHLADGRSISVPLSLACYKNRGVARLGVSRFVTIKPTHGNNSPTRNSALATTRHAVFGAVLFGKNYRPPSLAGRSGLASGMGNRRTNGASLSKHALITSRVEGLDKWLFEGWFLLSTLVSGSLFSIHRWPRALFQRLSIPDHAFAGIAGEFEILGQFERIRGTGILAQSAEHAPA